MDMPKMGFGTYGRTGNEGIEAILFALETGYRHIDTAQSYDTESECGRAIAASGLSRNQVFITTKIHMPNLRAGRLVQSLQKSRDTLGLDSLDLTLVHWPVDPEGEIPMDAYIDDLARAKQDGLTKNIGVSNFTIAQLERARTLLGDTEIACNQFERHVYLQNEKLADACREKGIAITCYCPIAHGGAAGDDVLSRIAAKHDANATRIALAFLMEAGDTVIPTSGKKQRIADNFAALNVTLDRTDIAEIAALDRNARHVDPDWAPQWDR